MLKTILIEDDCAPDARAYFCQEMLRIVGVPLHTFKFKASHTSEQTTIQWRFGKFVLEYDCTDPVYKLLQEIDDGNEEKHNTAPAPTAL